MQGREQERRQRNERRGREQGKEGRRARERGGAVGRRSTTRVTSKTTIAAVASLFEHKSESWLKWTEGKAARRENVSSFEGGEKGKIAMG